MAASPAEARRRKSTSSAAPDQHARAVHPPLLLLFSSPPCCASPSQERGTSLPAPSRRGPVPNGSMRVGQSRWPSARYARASAPPLARQCLLTILSIDSATLPMVRSLMRRCYPARKAKRLPTKSLLRLPPRPPTLRPPAPSLHRRSLSRPQHLAKSMLNPLQQAPPLFPAQVCPLALAALPLLLPQVLPFRRRKRRVASAASCLPC